MTDITDQELRDAIEWGRLNEYSGDPAEANAAIVILATVEAPDPTLAERLQYRADLLDNGDPDGDTPKALRDLATDADQMEHDLTEARAEGERLTAVAEDYARRATAALTERDEARAEVEHLTAERDRLEAAQYLSDGSAWGGPVREPTVQKGAESNAETPTPADVQPGEAWLVKVDRETRTAVKDTDAAIPWNTVNPSGVFHAEYNEDVTLLTRLAPAPRTITNPDDLDRAKRDTIIRDARGVVCSRDSAGTAWTTFTNLTDQRRHIVLPATVLWEPEA